MHKQAYRSFQDGILPKVGMGGFICVPCASSLILQTTESLGFYTCLHWRQSRTPGSLTLECVTTKHTSLHWACNRHLALVGLPNAATGQAGKTEPGDFFHLRQSTPESERARSLAWCSFSSSLLHSL